MVTKEACSNSIVVRIERGKEVPLSQDVLEQSEKQRLTNPDGTPYKRPTDAQETYDELVKPHTNPTLDASPINLDNLTFYRNEGRDY